MVLSCVRSAGIHLIATFTALSAFALTFESGAVLNFEQTDELKTYPYNPQYVKYKEHIETPLRQLKVPQSFTLVEDFGSFMAWHAENTTGQFPDHTGLIAWQIQSGLNADFCIEDAKTLTGQKSAGFELSGYGSVQARCQNVIAQRFMNNPETGVIAYEEILRHWVQSGLLGRLNKLDDSMPLIDRVDFAFGARFRVADSMAHYAVYHRLYDFDQEERLLIEEMFENYVKTYDYYRALSQAGPYFSKVCDLSRRATVTPNNTNDHCGTTNLFTAVSSVLFGLEFENQTIFDYGIRHLEITLATFDSNDVFSAQAYRGMLALSYMEEMISESDKLAYAFDKAFQLDFMNFETVHGTTPASVYREILNIAYYPTKLGYYFGQNGYGADKRDGDFKSYLADIEAGKRSPESVWGAFNLAEFYLGGGEMGAINYPVAFAELLESTPNDLKWLIAGSKNIGFNNLVLRQATGQISTVSVQPAGDMDLAQFTNSDLAPSDSLDLLVSVDVKSLLLPGAFRCLIDVERFLQANQETNQIAEGSVNFEDGKLSNLSLHWFTGESEIDERQTKTALSLLNDGNLAGEFSAPVMFGSDSRTEFTFLGANGSAEIADTPEGRYTASSSGIELSFVISNCSELSAGGIQ